MLNRGIVKTQVYLSYLILFCILYIFLFLIDNEIKSLIK